jgi:chloride channel 3/4/5
MATIIRVFLVIVSYGCKVPAGIFVPSMAIGASFGRTVGILVQALHETMPDARFFSSCKPDVPCITPGTYAFLGAAAALSGIMHLTVSVVVIMFELTGALTYILPTMIVVGVTKAVSDRFGKGGIADRMIWFNGFPFLDNKEDHSFGVPVSQVMNGQLTVLPASGITIEEIGIPLRHHDYAFPKTDTPVEQILKTTKYQGFPIVQDRSSQLILGYINRSELKYGLDRARRERSIPPTARCFFAPPPRQAGVTPATPVSATVTVSGSAFSGGGLSVDFARFIDPTPLTVHPRLPLETVMEIFKKVGPRVVLVEHRGRLCGIVTRKDVLRFQFQVENREHPRSEDDIDSDRYREEKLWELIVHSVEWVRRKVRFWERRRVALQSDREIPDGVELATEGEVELDDRPRRGR